MTIVNRGTAECAGWVFKKSQLRVCDKGEERHGCHLRQDDIHMNLHFPRVAKSLNVT